MIQQPYDKPPITEAIIDIGFASQHDERKLSKAVAKLEKSYVNRRETTRQQVDIDVVTGESSIKTGHVPNTHQFSSIDMTQLLTIEPSHFILSQLAPYPGWDEFLGRFKRDWASFKDKMGFNEISRIGVRYINRLDIPISGPTIEQGQYLNIFPKLPPEIVNIEAYAIQVVRSETDIKCRLQMNSANMPSPIANHISFLVDQDIIRQVDVPQSDEDIFDLLDAIRLKKNSIFESCITNKSRELFNG